MYMPIDKGVYKLSTKARQEMGGAPRVLCDIKDTPNANKNRDRMSNKYL
jgi:hypothetical protein